MSFWAKTRVEATTIAFCVERIAAEMGEVNPEQVYRGLCRDEAIQILVVGR